MEARNNIIRLLNIAKEQYFLNRVFGSDGDNQKSPLHEDDKTAEYVAHFKNIADNDLSAQPDQENKNNYQQSERDAEVLFISLQGLLTYNYQTDILRDEARRSPIGKTFFNGGNKPGMLKVQHALATVYRVCVALYSGDNPGVWISRVKVLLKQLKSAIDSDARESEIKKIIDATKADLKIVIADLKRSGRIQTRDGFTAACDILEKSLNVPVGSGRYNKTLQAAKKDIKKSNSAVSISERQIALTHINKHLLPILLKLSLYDPSHNSGKGSTKRIKLRNALLDATDRVAMPTDRTIHLKTREDITPELSLRDALLRKINESEQPLQYLQEVWDKLLRVDSTKSRPKSGGTLSESLYTLRDKFYGNDWNFKTDGSKFNKLLNSVIPQAELARAELVSLQTMVQYKSLFNDEQGELKADSINNRLYIMYCVIAAKSPVDAAAVIVALSNSGNDASNAAMKKAQAVIDGDPEIASFLRAQCAKLDGIGDNATTTINKSNVLTELVRIFKQCFVGKNVSSGYHKTMSKTAQSVITAYENINKDINHLIGGYSPKTPNTPQGKKKGNLAGGLNVLFNLLNNDNSFTALKKFSDILGIILGAGNSLDKHGRIKEISSGLMFSAEDLSSLDAMKSSRKDVGLRARLQLVHSGLQETLKSISYNMTSFKNNAEQKIKKDCADIIPNLVKPGKAMTEYRVQLSAALAPQLATSANNRPNFVEAAAKSSKQREQSSNPQDAIVMEMAAQLRAKANNAKHATIEH
jgi:hypothetical protein